MEINRKKISFWKNPAAQIVLIIILILCCIAGYYIYNLSYFWVKPGTAVFLPEEGQGLYLGMPVSELKTVKSKLTHFKKGKYFIAEMYYEKNIGGKYFNNAYYAVNSFGRMVNPGFSRHMSAEIIEKEKYGYINYFVSKYGADYKKGIEIFKPYKNKRFIYEMFIWQKKEARIVLEFSFYDNKKDGYLCKDRGVYLSINYPEVKSEGSHSKLIEDGENAEFKEVFNLHFPELDKKSGKPAITPEKVR